MDSAHRVKREMVLKKLKNLPDARPLLMGIVNITPDSMFPLTRVPEPTAAVRLAEHMIKEGADILDIGAESTRPYTHDHHIPISPEEEWERLAPVLHRLQALPNLPPLSIDTRKSAIAKRVLQSGLGAVIINDVGGLQRDGGMAEVVAHHEALIVIMYDELQTDPEEDIFDHMFHFFDRSLTIAEKASIPKEHIILDPGIGFSTPQQRKNIQMIAQLSRLENHYGLPLLIGASNKIFLGDLFGIPVGERTLTSVLAHFIAFQEGARVVRAHNIEEHRRAFQLLKALREEKKRMVGATGIEPVTTTMST